MKTAVITILSLALAAADHSPIYRPAPPPPAPYRPAPVYHKPAPPPPAYHKPAPPPAYHKPAPSYGGQDPYYEETAPFYCPSYPYCSEAPYQIGHLQYEIESLRNRAALIEKHGAALARQQPNQPFVGGFYY